MKDKITLLYTFWDTKKEKWLKSLDSACQLGLNIVIINDQSSLDYYYMLKNTTEKYQKQYPNINIKIYTPPKKLQQEGATYYGIQKINTPYIIRIDSDDIILGIPSKDLSEGYDIYLAGPYRCTNLYDYLSGSHPTSNNGNIYKKEILELMYKDWNYMKNHHKYWPEDIFTSIRLFILKPDVTVKTADKKYYKVVAGGKEHSKKKLINKKIKRLEILLTVCLRCNIPANQYFEYSNYLFNTMKDNN